ncbi:glycosyl transferase, partial [Pimelobacter simplex]
AAYQACPWRAEPLVEAARLERSRQRHEVALLYARAAAALPMPGGEALFVQTSTYTWRAWDEVAVSAYWTGRYDEGLAAARRALAVRPDDERLQANVAWCTQALAG